MQQYGVSLNYFKLGLGIQNQFSFKIFKQQINVQHEVKIGHIYLVNAFAVLLTVIWMCTKKKQLFFNYYNF